MVLSSRQQLDVRIIKAWRIMTLASFCILIVPALFGGVTFLIESPTGLTRVVVGVLWTVLAIGVWFATWVMPHWKYHSWSYRLDEGLVEIRNGILWNESVTIPISRLQHVDMHRGPLDRRFGIASLVLHTAGTRHAEHTIPGLDTDVASSVRDLLIRSIEAEQADHDA